MKTILSLCLALAALSSADAQVVRSDLSRRGDRTTLLNSPHRSDPGHRHSPRVQVRVGYGAGNHGYYRGHGYGYRGYRDFGYRTYSYGPRYGYGYGYVPSTSYYSGYGADYPYYGTTGYYGTTSGASNGLLLGALAGGIIGHNSGSLGHNGWRGAAWGAGLGWLLGSVADANRGAAVYRQAPVIVQHPTQVQAQLAAAAPTPAQPQTVINNYYYNSTPMSGANTLFGR